MSEPDPHGWCDNCYCYAILARVRIKGKQLCLTCYRKIKESR